MEWLVSGLFKEEGTVQTGVGASMRQVPAPVRDRKILDWLLEKDQPAVRYAALVDLLDRRPDDIEVRSARSLIPRVGWAAEQLRRQRPGGFWEPHEPRNVRQWVNFLYFPKFHSTFWRALVLSDMGLDATNPRIKKVADLVFNYKLRLGSPVNFFYEEASISGNTARMMTRFGYAEDFRVQKLFDWLVEDQREDGGWNGEQGAPGTVDTSEPLAAFAALPKAKRLPKVQRAIERGAEFYLERKLLGRGRPTPERLWLHYPTHYYYDILVGLDLLTQLGFGSDRRLRSATDLLTKKRRSDGRWAMDRPHPDSQNPKPLVIEEIAKPSKWITLRALRVLKRVNEAS
jgi:hypothetical protein